MDFRSAIIATLASLAALIASYLDTKFFNRTRTNYIYMELVAMTWFIVYSALELIPYEFLRDTGIQFLGALGEPVMTGTM